uniref:Uncharacterized protein n=1 Tax=Timema shepardi TaxID=629360 RepID=A0A7R9G330_TIMSH|nr:unnamed protein product [Timema shepardi]
MHAYINTNHTQEMYLYSQKQLEQCVFNSVSLYSKLSSSMFLLFVLPYFFFMFDKGNNAEILFSMCDYFYYRRQKRKEEDVTFNI